MMFSKVKFNPENSERETSFSENKIFTSPLGEIDEIFRCMSGLFVSSTKSVTPSNVLLLALLVSWLNNEKDFKMLFAVYCIRC